MPPSPVAGNTIIPRKRRRIVLSLRRMRRALPEVIRLAREWEWDLLDLDFTRGSLPPEPLGGAIFECMPTDPLAVKLRERGCPSVRLGLLPHPQDSLLSVVLQDQGGAGRLAAEYLAERGFKHVAHVASVPWSVNRQMHDAFKGHARSLGLTCDLFRIESGSQADTDAEKASKFERQAMSLGAWLRDLPKPVGILTYRDSLAARLCVICQRNDMVVPDEVALLGVGNDELMCEVSPVQLSSVDIAWDEMGRQGALLLRSLIGGAPAPRAPVLVPPHGVASRRSTEVLAVSDPRVASAIRFLWDHLEQDVSVRDVANAVGMPRRSLERAFHDKIGRGVSAELQRKRLERCCELLESTDLPIIELAPLTGFRSADYLHTAFRKAFGTTPRQYRLKKSGNAAGV